MRSLTVAIAWCWATICAAQQPLEVDEAEVLRLGNVVQSVGSGARSSEIDEYVEALAPPASDADRWFLSVVTTRGCKACEQLKQEWIKNAWLLALANPTDPKQSWAHYNVYLHGDQSQSFRFDKVQITGYPTIILQPPRSGKYGDPKTVVFQGVYGGDPQELAEGVTKAIRQYVDQLKPAVVGGMQEAAAASPRHDPPWQPVPKDDSSNVAVPDVLPLERLLQIIPPRPPSAEIPWSAVLSLISAGVSLPTAATMLLWLIYAIRARRKAVGKPPLIEPAALDRLLELLKALAEKSPPPPTSRV